MFSRHRAVERAQRSGAPPVSVIHAAAPAPGSSPRGRGLGGLDGMAPYYEADIRPGERLVMPGFTISVEATAPAARRQHPAAVGQSNLLTSPSHCMVLPMAKVSFQVWGGQPPLPFPPSSLP